MWATNKSGCLGWTQVAILALYNRGVRKKCLLEWVSLLTNDAVLGFPGMAWGVEDMKTTEKRCNGFTEKINKREKKKLWRGSKKRRFISFWSNCGSVREMGPPISGKSRWHIIPCGQISSHFWNDHFSVLHPQQKMRELDLDINDHFTPVQRICVNNRCGRCWESCCC